MKRLPLLAIASSSLLLAGCSSVISNLANAQPSSSPPCTSNACITASVEHQLVGMTAKDGAVSTKAVCQASTLKRNPGNTYTVSCRVTDSDGGVYQGYGNLTSTEITFEPTRVITPPSSS
jgi:hypothetical protein